MDIQFPLILFQIINFSIVLFILNKFLYKPIVKILQQRQEKIEAGHNIADENVKTQEKLEKTKKDILKKAQIDAGVIVVDTKKTAQKEAQEILDKAKSDAKKVLAKERKAFESSMVSEKKELEKQFTLLVTQTSEAMLKKYLKKSDQQTIIDAQLKELKSFTLN